MNEHFQRTSVICAAILERLRHGQLEAVAPALKELSSEIHEGEETWMRLTDELGKNE